MLYLVATPIGNLGDITLRALEVLRSVDVIASEDTRKTGILLKHFGISKPQIAFEEHNEDRAGARILSLLARGESVALVTEAGTPGISDPGYTLVRRALASEEEVTMIPGPSAAIMALVLSGLPVHSFTFRGFAPRKSGVRGRFLEVDATSPHTLIFYESPYRLLGFLEDALAVFGDRQGAVAHELTKLHESLLRGGLAELVEQVRQNKPRGEYVVVIGGVDRALQKTLSGALEEDAWEREDGKTEETEDDEVEDQSTTGAPDAKFDTAEPSGAVRPRVLKPAGRAGAAGEKGSV